ncbi:MAG: RidA family protein [Kofleriaceae bacterium]
MSTNEIEVPEWPTPKGYANGRVGSGPALHVGGQIGWNASGELATGMVAQFAQTLSNVLAVVRAAGGVPSDIAAMTVYVTDIAAYRDARHDLGPVWRERMGHHYPAMALVGVTALVEPGALVEIESVAYLGAEP